MLLDIRACRLTDGLLAWMDHHGPLPPFDIPADVPLRIAWPLKDRLTPWREYGRPFHALIPRAERVQLDDVGHVPMYDDPRLVADTILSQTRRLTPRAGRQRTAREVTPARTRPACWRCAWSATNSLRKRARLLQRWYKCPASVDVSAGQHG